ncbi:MAG: hypothetical protein EKK64_10005 [Neisseriaceae bacterium]|nr:MAG: hypothetical protein EKK64_10005 [Neisseriaceae bacterium]
MSKNLIIILLTITGSVFAADQITTDCIKESGSTMCKAYESNQQVMNLNCNHADGKSSCSGQYFDEKANNVDMSCDIDSNSFKIKCSGGSGKDKFSLSCGPADLEIGKFACDATDASDESLHVMCDMMNMANGIPDCSGIDAKGVKHSINCNSDGNGKSSCSIE